MFAVPNFCNDTKTLAQIISLTKFFWPKFCTHQKLWPKIFRWPKFLQWPKNVDPNFLTQNFSFTQISAMTQKRWPKILLWPKFFDPKFFVDPIFAMTQKHWPKILLWPKFFTQINGDPKFYNGKNFGSEAFDQDFLGQLEPKILTVCAEGFLCKVCLTRIFNRQVWRPSWSNRQTNRQRYLFCHKSATPNNKFT